MKGIVSMKRLAIITVGKTHSGKSTFARALEKKLSNAVVVDQDHHAEFIHTYYRDLLPKQGTNTLKFGLTKFIVTYAIDTTDKHLIICNSNRSQKGRLHLFEAFFDKNEFIRVLVHFDIPDHILKERVARSERSTTIFRDISTTFEELLHRQQHEDVTDPVEGEVDELFVIRSSEEIDAVIETIVTLAK